MEAEDSNPFLAEEEDLGGKNPFDDDTTGDFEVENDLMENDVDDEITYEISTSNQTNDTVEPSYHHPTLQVKFLYFYSQLIKAHFYREIRIKDSFI